MDLTQAELDEIADLFAGDEPTDGVTFDLIETEPEETDEGRFRGISEADVEAFLRQQENSNTKRKTRGDIALFKSHLSTKSEMRDPEFIPPRELDGYISNFLLSVRKKNGNEYEPTTLRSFISSIDRYLREKKYGFSLITDFQFDRSRQVLKSKQKELKSLGKGNKPQASDELTDDDIQQLINCKQLGPFNPVSLLNSLWLNNCLHFGLRTGRESHELKWGDIILKEDEDGEQYLEYSVERQTKTRTGANPRDVRMTKPRAFATPDMPERDPVGLYLLYQSKRPISCLSADSPFYLNRNVLNPREDQAWFKVTPMGINKLYHIMKDMKKGAQMSDENKRLTPYSARKHLVQKLSDEGVPPTQIMQISGHKNVQSVNNYSKLNMNQSRNISHLLSGRKQPDMNMIATGSLSHNSTLSMSQSTTNNGPLPAHSTSFPSFNYPGFPGLFVGNTFQGPVNVHFHQHTNPESTTRSTTSQMTATSSEQYEFVLPASAPISQADFTESTRSQTDTVSPLPH